MQSPTRQSPLHGRDAIHLARFDLMIRPLAPALFECDPAEHGVASVTSTFMSPSVSCLFGAREVLSLSNAAIPFLQPCCRWLQDFNLTAAELPNAVNLLLVLWGSFGKDITISCLWSLALKSACFGCSLVLFSCWTHVASFLQPASGEGADP